MSKKERINICPNCGFPDGDNYNKYPHSLRNNVNITPERALLLIPYYEGKLKYLKEIAKKKV